MTRPRRRRGRVIPVHGVSTEGILTPISVERDDRADTITIEGITYSQEFFRQFGHAMPLDTPLKLTSREGGVLTVCQMEPRDPDWNGGPE